MLNPATNPGGKGRHGLPDRCDVLAVADDMDPLLGNAFEKEATTNFRNLCVVCVGCVNVQVHPSTTSVLGVLMCLYSLIHWSTLPRRRLVRLEDVPACVIGRALWWM